MKILITGATGLIGSQLLPILPKSWTVYAASRHRGIDEVEWLYSDLSQRDCCKNFPKQIDAVIHLAQSEHHREFPEQARDLFGVNITATQQLLEYARQAGARRFVMTSSGSVYQAQDKPLKEDDPWAKDTGSAYARSKMAAEILANAYRDFFPVICLRPFFVYGIGQKPNMLMPRLIRSVVEGQPIYLDQPNGLTINPIAACDAAAAVLEALAVTHSCAINLAGPEVACLRNLCELIGKLAGRPPVFEEQPGQAVTLVGDTTRMASWLVHPKTGIEAGLERMIPVSCTGRC